VKGQGVIYPWVGCQERAGRLRGLDGHVVLRASEDGVDDCGSIWMSVGYNSE